MTSAPAAEPDFLHQAERYRGELRLYCYRMLGSSHDSDAQVREVFARAGRDQAAASDPARLRAWLYRRATELCLAELNRRRELRGAATEGVDPSELTDDDLTAERERWPAPWVEPCPDSWWQQVSGDAPLDRRHSVGLSFLTALQQLPPPQRAALVLRDAVGLSADDAAAAIGLDTLAAEAAATQARASLAHQLGTPRPTGADQVLLARYARAWHDGDVDALIALLHDELHTSMPPSPTSLVGRDANLAFYRQMFGDTRKGPVRMRRVAANGQPAFAFYRAAAPDQPCALRAIQLVGLRDGKIARIDQFMLPMVFPLFGVPGEISLETR